MMLPDKDSARGEAESGESVKLDEPETRLKRRREDALRDEMYSCGIG